MECPSGKPFGAIKCLSFGALLAFWACKLATMDWLAWSGFWRAVLQQKESELSRACCDSSAATMAMAHLLRCVPSFCCCCQGVTQLWCFNRQTAQNTHSSNCGCWNDKSKPLVVHFPMQQRLQCVQTECSLMHRAQKPTSIWRCCNSVFVTKSTTT